MTTDPFRPPAWGSQTLPEPLVVPPSTPETAWRGWDDVKVAAVVTFCIALSGALVGLIWSRLAPTLTTAGIRRIAAGSAAPFHAQVGADAWFLLVTALAGVACGLVALTLRNYGPGVVIGLALGGSAAAVIAARVGYLAQRSHTLAAMHALGIPAHNQALNLLDFKVRALGVVAAWPFAALVVYSIVLAIRTRQRSLP